MIYIVRNIFSCFFSTYVAVLTYVVVSSACGLRTFRGDGSAQLWWLVRVHYEHDMGLGLLCMGGGMCSSSF
jgi:hypothetical protein